MEDSEEYEYVYEYEYESSDDDEYDERYKDGKIYKLVNSVDSNIYVGSTRVTLEIRLTIHRGHARQHRYRNNKVYTHLNSIGWDKIEIKLIEVYPCNSKKELFKREQYWQDKLNPKLNANKASVSYEDNLERMRHYWANNKESLSVKSKQYREKNKESLSIYMRQYRKNNNTQLSIRKKQYYETHKDLILELRKQYRDTNREKISDDRKQKIDCACGSIISKGDIAKHKRTKKHQNFENKNK